MYLSHAIYSKVYTIIVGGGKVVIVGEGVIVGRGR